MATIQRYILTEAFQVVPASMTAWSAFFGNPRRIIANSYIGDIRVSTVFIGLPNDIFETIIFFNDKDERQEEYTYNTYREALEGHTQRCTDIVEGHI